MVPTKEMPDVFKVIKGFDGGSLKPGMWVRVKKGLYKEDLAQVSYRNDCLLQLPVMSLVPGNISSLYV